MLKKFKEWLPRKKATHFANAEKADISALRALMNGTADEHQQKRALSWIVHQASGMYEVNYFDNERDTSFALGRAFVGQQIVGLLNINPQSERQES